MEKFGTKEENSLTVLKHFVCSAAPHKTLCPGILLSCSLLPLHNEWVQWLERGSVNAAEIECYSVNANIAIARPPAPDSDHYRVAQPAWRPTDAHRYGDCRGRQLRVRLRLPA